MRLVAIWTAFTVVLLSWMGTRYIQSQGSCLKSSFVKMIVIADEKKTIDQCNLADRLLTTSEVSADQRQWIREIRSVEDLWPSLKVKSKPIVIEVKESDPFYYSVQSGIVSLGGQVMRSEGLLEKAILEAWLMQKNPQADRYTLDVLSDVLSSMVRTSDQWQDPTTNETFQLSKSYWPEQLTNFENYCLSSHKSPAHILFCANQEKRNETGLNVWSAKQMLSGLIYEFSTQLTLSEREQLISSIANLQIPGFPQTASRTEFYTWTQSVLDSVFQKHMNLAAFFEIQKKQKGLQEEVVFPLVIHFEDETVDPNRFTKLIQWSLNKPVKSVAISTEGRLHLLPDFNPLNLKAGEWKARRMLWVSCAMPTTEQISNIRAEKVTAMKICPSDKDLDWERLMVSDIEEFLLHHEDVSYFDIHVPSLQLAISTGTIKDTKMTIDQWLKLNLSVKSEFGRNQIVSHPISFLTKYRN